MWSEKRGHGRSGVLARVFGAPWEPSRRVLRQLKPFISQPERSLQRGAGGFGPSSSSSAGGCQGRGEYAIGWWGKRGVVQGVVQGLCGGCADVSMDPGSFVGRKGDPT